ncbi:MAG: hypothetical protein WBA75_00405 [Sphingopyxis granuli]
MDLALFLQWAGAVGLVLGVLNTAWTMVGKAAKPLNEKVTAVEGQLVKYRADLVDHDRRIQALEGEQRHVPTGEQVTGLRITVERLDGHIKRLEESMTGLSHTVRRMDEFLRRDQA